MEQGRGPGSHSWSEELVAALVIDIYTFGDHSKQYRILKSLLTLITGKDIEPTQKWRTRIFHKEMLSTKGGQFSN